MSPKFAMPLASWFELATVWVFIWAALAVATVAGIVLLRTRWRNIKSWKKCAILSLWVHVLLACLTTVVHIFSAAPGYGPGYGPGFGPGEAIRVALLPDEAFAAQPIGEPDPEQTTAAESESEIAVDAAVETTEAAEAEPAPEPEPSAPLDAPDLLAAPQPVAAPDAVAIDLPDDEEEPDAAVDPPAATADDVPAKSEAKPGPPQTSTAVAALPSDGAAPSSTSASAKSSPKASGRPAAYAARFAANRGEVVAGGGGNDRTERAVAASLAWLAEAQSADGRWDAKRHGAGQERYVEGSYVLGQNRGGAGAKADAGVTGLALLAMLGAGHTHQDGPYAAHVARGLGYLRKSQQSSGDLGGQAEFFAHMYCHSMATFALSEAYAMTRDNSLASSVQNGVRYSLAAQHPTDGGWRYVPGNTGDTSQLGWQLMALKSAQLGGVNVPGVTWTRCERFLRQVERGLDGGLAAYRPEGPPTRTMTAEALYCRQLLTGRADGQLSAAALDEAVSSLLKEQPSSEHVNLYYWYYATLALHQAQHASPEAGEAWRRWNDALVRTLVATQESDGSWPATCLWGGYGGRVYTTALGAMCLESYYRYAPVDNRDGAASEPADVAQSGDGWHSAAPR